jgi:hypothetical protein
MGVLGPRNELSRLRRPETIGFVVQLSVRTYRHDQGCAHRARVQSAGPHRPVRRGAQCQPRAWTVGRAGWLPVRLATCQGRHQDRAPPDRAAARLPSEQHWHAEVRPAVPEQTRPRPRHPRSRSPGSSRSGPGSIAAARLSNMALPRRGQTQSSRGQARDNRLHHHKARGPAPASPRCSEPGRFPKTMEYAQKTRSLRKKPEVTLFRYSLTVS